MNADSTDNAQLQLVFNLPNLLTALRLALAGVMICFLAVEFYRTSFVLFIFAAATDWGDGYLARKYCQVTKLGRIFDPLADKLIICGTFIMLAAVPEMNAVPWGLRPWMVVVIVGRELLVTALRSFIEQRGGDFSARKSGKLKMFVQCLAAGVCLFYLACDTPESCWAGCLPTLLVGTVWAAVGLTIYSGLVYIWAAWKLLARQ